MELLSRCSQDSTPASVGTDQDLIMRNNNGKNNDFNDVNAALRIMQHNNLDIGDYGCEDKDVPCLNGGRRSLSPTLIDVTPPTADEVRARERIMKPYECAAHSRLLAVRMGHLLKPSLDSPPVTTAPAFQYKRHTIHTGFRCFVCSSVIGLPRAIGKIAEYCEHTDDIICRVCRSERIAHRCVFPPNIPATHASYLLDWIAEITRDGLSSKTKVSAHQLTVPKLLLREGEDCACCTAVGPHYCFVAYDIRRSFAI